MRDSIVRTVTAFAAIAVVMTEALGAVGWLRPAPLGVAWLVVGVIAARRLGHVPRLRIPRLGWFERALVAGCGAIVGIVAMAAVLSPPNSADAMAYHLPRVVYWAQAASVSFFATPYYNQVMLAPAAEYLMLHTYLLSGGDRLVNLIACGAFAGCLVAVSVVAREMRLGSRGQALAAFAAATLPNAILQGSGAKNDMLLALWVVCAVYFTLRREALWVGVAVGLAVATKATAVLFLPTLLLVAWVIGGAKAPAQTGSLPHIAAWMAIAVAVLNGRQFVRNMRLSGSPMGFDSAHGDGRFRWRNEHLGWRQMVSNVLRHGSEQLGGRSEAWNGFVYRAVVETHAALGLDPNDPDTTWPGSRFAAPRNANHEANANNRWHLCLMLAAGMWAAIRPDRRWILYGAGLAGAFLLFCLYLKWQPFLARLELPIFVAASPLIAWLVERWRPSWLACALCLFLLSGARLALFENWTRPLRGANSLWVSRRDDDYFRDMGQWNNRASYVEAVDRVARSGCALVGIDISENQLEYPFQALLRERSPRVRFVHAEGGGTPCAMLCMDCIGNEQKISRYSSVGQKIDIGRFLLFLRGPG